MRVVHLGTRLSVVLGVLDENGDIINRTPVELSTERFSAEALLALFDQVVQAREAAERALHGDAGQQGGAAQIEPSATPEPAESTGG